MLVNKIYQKKIFNICLIILLNKGIQKIKKKNVQIVYKILNFYEMQLQMQAISIIIIIMKIAIDLFIYLFY